jgi:hypothetical protein
MHCLILMRARAAILSAIQYVYLSGSTDAHCFPVTPRHHWLRHVCALSEVARFPSSHIFGQLASVDCILKSCAVKRATTVRP